MYDLVAFLVTELIKGHDDLCEDFFAYNRAKGTLYDGETRLFLRSSGKRARSLSFISFLLLPLPDASTVFVVLLSNILSRVFILPILSFFDKIIVSVLISY